MHLNIKGVNGKYYVFVITCLCSLLAGMLVNLLEGWISNNDKSVSWNDGKYTGDLVNGIPDGNGCFIKDGIIYTGFWQKGEMTNGTMKTDKMIYEGDFKNRKIDGYGVAKYKDGKAYWGYWKNDYKEGLGLYLNNDGSLVFGFFRNGIVQIVKGNNYTVGDHVYGIDVSRHQGIISWQDLFLECDIEGIVNGELSKTSNYIQPILFSIIKSTQGVKIKDVQYDSNYSEAKRCGKICGAYHFLTQNASGEEQAKFYISNTILSKGDFPPIIDIEKNTADKKHISDKEFASIIPIAKEFIATVKAHYGVSPIIYTNMNVYNKFIAKDSELNKYDLWLAAPGRNKPNVKNCIIWQFSHSGNVNGIKDNVVDINLFDGNYKTLNNYIKAKGIH